MKEKKNMIFQLPYLYSYIALITKDDNNDITTWDSAKGKKTSLNVSSNYAKIAEKYEMVITASETFSEGYRIIVSWKNRLCY